MNRVELLNKMNSIVKEQVKHYDSDFMYDIDFMYTTSDKKFIWIVRKYGTNIVRLWPADNDSETIKNARLVLDCYKETADKTTIKNHYYIIDIVNNEIKKVTYNHVLARCYTKK